MRMTETEIEIFELKKNNPRVTKLLNPLEFAVEQYRSMPGTYNSLLRLCPDGKSVSFAARRCFDGLGSEETTFLTDIVRVDPFAGEISKADVILQKKLSIPKQIKFRKAEIINLCGKPTQAFRYINGVHSGHSIPDIPELNAKTAKEKYGALVDYAWIKKEDNPTNRHILAGFSVELPKDVEHWDSSMWVSTSNMLKDFPYRGVLNFHFFDDAMQEVDKPVDVDLTELADNYSAILRNRNIRMEEILSANTAITEAPFWMFYNAEKRELTMEHVDCGCFYCNLVISTLQLCEGFPKRIGYSYKMSKNNFKDEPGESFYRHLREEYEDKCKNSLLLRDRFGRCFSEVHNERGQMANRFGLGEKGIKLNEISISEAIHYFAENGEVYEIKIE